VKRDDCGHGGIPGRPVYVVEVHTCEPSDSGVYAILLHQLIYECDTITPGAAVPAGFGVPWNLFSEEHEPVIQAFCFANGVMAQIQKPSSIQYHYTYIQGHQWDSSISQWTPITYQCDEPLIGDVWCNANASATLNPAYPFFIAYTCSWINNAWKCGCRDQACTQNFWQLQQFQR
jgi:hypothetical protein